MKKLFSRAYWLSSLFFFAVLSSQAQTAGQVMFIGFNSDGDDGFSFVALVDIPANTTIFFTDNEWDGVSAFTAGEGFNSWSHTAIVPAGTVITIENLDNTPAITATLGTAIVDGGTAMGITGNNEAVYMYLGTNRTTPTTFLSAISNENFDAGGTVGSLTATGLSIGVNAIEFTLDQDLMVYLNNVNCNTTIANCAASIATITNWETDDGGASDHTDGYPDFPTDVCDVAGTLFNPQTTYYSFTSGDWDANTSWSLSSDGSTGAVPAGEWPRRTDNVVILNTHIITINDDGDNKSCGNSPDGLNRSNVGAFTGSGNLMFYHTGDILVANGGTLTSSVRILLEGYTLIDNGGTLTISNDIVNVGYLEVAASGNFTNTDDFVLSGNSITIINSLAFGADDIYIDHTDATLCGSGEMNLGNGGPDPTVQFFNSGTLAQICSTFTISCTSNCGAFPITPTGNFSVGNSGPGGVGNASTNKLWLMANQAVYVNAGTTLAADNQTVQQWNDQSGNGRHATEATNKPTYLTNIVNGMPAVRFDNTDRLLSTGLTTANSASVFVVAQYSSLPSTNPGLVQGSPSGLGFSGTGTDKVIGMWVSSATNRPWGRVVEADNNPVNIPQASALSASTFFVLSNIVSASSLNVSQYINNVVSGSVAYDGTLRSWTDFGIGRQGTETWFGDISEVVVYNTSLNIAQRVIVSNYLSAKYATTLSVANDVYTMDNGGNGNFDFEVAGIGQASDGSNHRDALGTGVVRMWNPNALDDGEFLIWGHDNTAITSSTTAVGTAVDGTIIEERLSRIWRVSEEGDVGTVSVSFDFSTVGGSPLGSNLRLLIDRDGDGFADNDVTPFTGSVANNIAVFSGVDFQTGDRFTLGNTDSSIPLPIELLYFSAAVQQNEVKLSWSTASELNNDFFTVQRSRDGETWNDVIEIKGAGTSSSKIDYETSDGMPLSGVSYYRLKQTDFDGQYAYSALRRVELKPTFQLKVFPNPSTGSFLISTGFEIEQGDVRLTNTLGQPMSFELQQDDASFVLNTGSLAKGIYILQLQKGFWRQSVRIVIE